MPALALVRVHHMAPPLTVVTI